MANSGGVKNLTQIHGSFLQKKFTKETRLTINTIDDASQKHSQPIKLHNFGHMQESLLHHIQMHSIWCKKPVQGKTSASL